MQNHLSTKNSNTWVALTEEQLKLKEMLKDAQAEKDGKTVATCQSSLLNIQSKFDKLAAVSN